MNKIFVLEDDESIQNQLKFLFKNEDVVVASNISEASKSINLEFNIFLIDLNLPDGNGIDFVSNLSDEYREKVVFLTGTNDSETIIKGINLGAQDYITKPFNPQELKARINQKINFINKHLDDKICLENFIIDRKNLVCLVNDKDIFLTAKEFKIVFYLVEHIGTVINRDDLVLKIWGNINIDQKTINAHISKIRKKLNCANYNIHSVYGEGYIFKRNEK